MNKLILLLCLCVSAFGQPLPLTWPQRPEGLVLGSLSPLRYDGAGVAGNPGELIFAWCDARDGDGRVVLQKVSSQIPDHPGRWHSTLPDWGEVDGLFLPAGQGAALLPWVVSDGQGGAVAVYEEVQNWSLNRLFVSRVGDGPQGTGAPAWEEPALVSTDVLIQTDGCRDAQGSRCRSVLYDGVKSACGDGAGGVWVLWRTMQSRLRLHHVNGDGSLDGDLPAEGLELSPGCYYFSLAADGHGNAVVAWQNWQSGGEPLRVQGVRADGSLMLPEGGLALTLAGETPDHPRLVMANNTRMAIAWINQSAQAARLHMQVLDEDLQPVLAAGGVDLGPGDPYGVVQAACVPDGPVHLAWMRDNQTRLQRVGLDGLPQWGEGVGINVVGDQTDVVLGAFAPVADGLACLLFDFGGTYGAYLQRLDSAGQPLWSSAQALLATFDSQWSPGALVADGAGGALAAWQQFSGNRRQLAIAHRDGQAQDLIPATRRVLENAREGYPIQLRVLADNEPPLALWTSTDALFAQAIDRSNGSPLLGAGGLETQPLQAVFDACADGENGAWMVGQAYPPGQTPADIVRLRLASDGQVLAPAEPLVPGLSAPDYWGVSSLLAAQGPQRLFAAAGIYAGLPQLRVQSCDLQGARLWGDAGAPIHHGMTYEEVTANLLASDGGAGCWLLWTLAAGWMNSTTYLQHLDGDGLPLIPDSNGRGAVVSTWFQANVDRASLACLPGGAVALAWTERYRNDGQNTYPSCFLRVIDEHGDTVWNRQLSSHLNNASRLERAAEDLLAIALVDDADASRTVRLLHFDDAGEPRGEWTAQLPFTAWPQDLALRRGTQGRSLTLVNYMAEAGLPCGVQGLSASAENGLEPDYCGFPTHCTETSSVYQVDVDAAGGAWVSWLDGRCLYSGYGNQLRLSRLGELDSALPPAEPVRPEALRLAPNWPNPFNPETWISFELAQAGPARLEIFNLAGQRVRVLHDGPLSAGAHRMRFDTRDESGAELGSGIYFSRLSAGGQIRAGRMLLVR